MQQIAVINQSTVASDGAVQNWTAAVQRQVHEHFAPAWGIDASVVFYAPGTVPKDTWQMVVLDNADQAGALGYHDLTKDGQPLGKVFAGTALRYGQHPSVVLSHEVLEMMADPDINLLVAQGKAFWSYEVCDAVEADELGYVIDDVPVSDFVLPAYFETFRKMGPFDYGNHLTKCLPALTPGGYMAYLDTRGRWHQVFGRDNKNAAANVNAEFRARPHPGSRRSRRMLDREDWLRSQV